MSCLRVCENPEKRASRDVVVKLTACETQFSNDIKNGYKAGELEVAVLHVESFSQVFQYIRHDASCLHKCRDKYTLTSPCICLQKHLYMHV